MELILFRDLGIATGLGLLIGLEREWSDEQVAGIRTFALIALFGALCALLGDPIGGGFLLPAGALAVAVIFWIGNRMRLADDSVRASGVGITTEMAGLVAFLVGALAVTDYTAVAVVVTGVVAVLLHWKRPLHGFVSRIGDDQFRAIVRLVIIGMVILPVMPDRTFGPYDVLNPFRIWLMVVLIVGISMGAWIAQRLVGPRSGTLLAGVLGGLISSTALTVSYARRARARTEDATAAALVIMIASTIVFARVLVEIAVVVPGRLASLGAPLGAMMGWMALIAAVGFIVARSSMRASGEQEPSDELRAAVVFGLLYAGVLLAVAAAREHLGERALFAVAGLSGLTDMDAITLSTAQLVNAGRLDLSTAWRLILVGAMANIVFKAAAVAVLGGIRLARRVAVLFAASLVGGFLLLRLWPA